MLNQYLHRKRIIINPPNREKYDDAIQEVFKPSSLDISATHIEIKD